MIERFDGPYHFLSNFTGGVEEKYQASKATNVKDYNYVIDSCGPKEAKKRGRQIKIREDFDLIKDGIMYNLVKEKFSKNPFKQQLLDTGDEEIVEGNWWGDTYWGVCSGKGLNKLGKILMRVREELKQT